MPTSSSRVRSWAPGADDVDEPGAGTLEPAVRGRDRFTQTSPVKYYRVKAIGKGAAGESDLSNIVTVESDRSNIAAFAGAKLVAISPRPRTPTLRKGSAA